MITIKLMGAFSIFEDINMPHSFKKALNINKTQFPEHAVALSTLKQIRLLRLQSRDSIISKRATAIAITHKQKQTAMKCAPSEELKTQT